MNEISTGKRLDDFRDDVKGRFDQVDKRFDQVDKRFEQVDKRFEQVDRRFEQVDRRFDRVEDRIIAQGLEMKRGFEAMYRVIIGSAVGIAIAFIGASHF